MKFVGYLVAQLQLKLLWWPWPSSFSITSPIHHCLPCFLHRCWHIWQSVLKQVRIDLGDATDRKFHELGWAETFSPLIVCFTISLHSESDNSLAHAGMQFPDSEIPFIACITKSGKLIEMSARSLFTSICHIGYACDVIRW